LRGVASFGWRIFEGDNAVADAAAIDRSTLPGIVGTYLAAPGEARRNASASAWISYEGVRLLDGADLADYIPIGEQFDYVVVGARGDLRIGAGLGAKLEGFLGTDLADSSFLFGVEAGVTWRPAERTELSALLGYGTATGREGDDTSLAARITFAFRW
jgi:hypothetical protein